MREQQYIADGRRIGQQHDQPVNADALANRRRHAIFQCTHVIMVVMHSLFVARLFLYHLLAEACRLVFCIVELGKAVGQLAPADKKLEALGHKRIIVAAARQRRHLSGIGGNEGWLIQSILDAMFKNLQL